MIRADLTSALAEAVRGSVTAGEIAVTIPGRVPLTWGDGMARTPLALMLGCDPEPIARRLEKDPRVAGVSAVDGVLVIVPAAGAVLKRMAEFRGPVLATGDGWAERPLTFENPGFRVRFAYSRAACTMRWARELGVDPAEPVSADSAEERRLVGLLAELPERVDQSVRKQDPRPLRKQLERTADAYHDVFERRPALPKGDQEPGRTHGERVTLARGVQKGLATGLRMLGETPRERI